MGWPAADTTPWPWRPLRAVAEDLGRRLLALGINVDFAPVLDVLTEPTNTAIGDRAFGTDAEAVRIRAGAFLDGSAREPACSAA